MSIFLKGVEYGGPQPIATASAPGISKPDGTSIDVDESGTLSVKSVDANKVNYDNSSSQIESGTAQAAIDLLVTKIAELENRLSSAEGNISTSSSKISALEGKVSSDETNISTLQNGLSAAQNNISKLQTGVATNTSDISTLKADVSTNTTNISTNASNISAINGKITTIENTLNKALIVEDNN